MDGIALGARFSLATNRLGYCGPDTAEPLLYGAITRGANLEAAGKALLRFEALAPYLEAIAAKHGRKPLDREVVEAYWIGNSLLDPFTREDFVGILESLVCRGLPRRMANRLADRLPSHPFPHHAFHVAYVGVGNVTGHVATTLANMEACRPALAEVEAVAGDVLVISKPSLREDGGRIEFGDRERTESRFDAQVLPGIRPGARVALHWGWPAMELSTEQAFALEHYSQRAWAMANEARVLGERVAP